MLMGRKKEPGNRAEHRSGYLMTARRHCQIQPATAKTRRASNTCQKPEAMTKRKPTKAMPRKALK